MKPYRKDKARKPQQAKEGFLSLSIVVPDAGHGEGLSMLLDSVMNIKKPYEKDYELILISSEAEKQTEWLSGNPGFKNLLDKNIIRVFPSGTSTTLADSLAAGIREASKEYSLILETAHLERSFSLEAIFSVRPEVLHESPLMIPRFQDSPAKGRRIHHPALLMGSSLANYLFVDTGFAGDDFQADLFRMLRNLDLECSDLPVLQKSPFGEISRKGSGFFRRIASRLRFFIRWFFVLPVQEFRTRPHLKYPFIGSPSYLRLAYASLAVLLFVLMPLLSLDSAISGDEQRFHYRHGKNVYNYFATLGKDTTALYYDRSVLHLYGPAFDLVTVIVNRALGIENEFEARHVLNAWSGWLAMIFAGLLAVMLAGWRAGLMALVFIFLSPRFLGHSFNNPKDIPFAMATIFTLYFMIRFLREFPRPKWSTVLLAGLGIGMAIGVRVGGLLLIAYFFLFSGLYFLFTEKIRNLFARENMRRLARLLMYLVLISLIGYVLGIITWPYALQSPISNPLKAMEVMTNYATSIRQLFEGQIIWSNRAPWYYVPKYILITVPLVVLTGLVLFFILIPKMGRKINYLWIFIIAFTFLFPIIYIIDKESNVYGGWRHSMFVYPSIVIAASLGFETLFRLSRKRYLRYILASVIALLCLLPLRHIVFNHPYEYIYYNELTGGTNGALGKYEMDYYYHSIREGSEWLIENRIKDSEAGPGNKIIVASNFSIDYYFRHYQDRIQYQYVRYYDRGSLDWDYAIIANSYINPYQLKNKLFPPPNAIHTIYVDKVPVCTILERKSKLDFQGITFLNQRDYARAIPTLEQAVKEEPWNEAALMGLARAYLQTRRFEKATETIARCLKVYPDYDKALDLLGVVYINERKMSEAVSVFTRIIQVNERYVTAYHNLGLIYARQNNADMALRYFQEAIRVNRNFGPSYQAIGEILQRQGRTEEARQYFEIARSL